MQPHGKDVLAQVHAIRAVAGERVAVPSDDAALAAASDRPAVRCGVTVKRRARASRAGSARTLRAHGAGVGSVSGMGP